MDLRTRLIKFKYTHGGWLPGRVDNAINCKWNRTEQYLQKVIDAVDYSRVPDDGSCDAVRLRALTANERAFIKEFKSRDA